MATVGTGDHIYTLDLVWTGNTGSGTATRRGYSRDHEVSVSGAGVLLGTADPVFRGVPDRWNPEQLFLASIAQCHMLTYLWLAAGTGVVVTAYADSPQARMRTQADGSGQFESVLLHPRVTIEPGGDVELARSLHDRVGEYCFIARSVNVPLHHEAEILVR